MHSIRRPPLLSFWYLPKEENESIASRLPLVTEVIFVQPARNEMALNSTFNSFPKVSDARKMFCHITDSIGNRLIYHKESEAVTWGQYFLLVRSILIAAVFLMIRSGVPCKTLVQLICMRYFYFA